MRRIIGQRSSARSRGFNIGLLSVDYPNFFELVPALLCDSVLFRVRTNTVNGSPISSAYVSVPGAMMVS